MKTSSIFPREETKEAGLGEASPLPPTSDFRDSLSLSHPDQVGERIQCFYHQWILLTSDKWSLQLILHSHCLEFLFPPPNISPVHKVSLSKLKLMKIELTNLLENNAIERVPSIQGNQGVYSHLSSKRQLLFPLWHRPHFWFCQKILLS